MKTSSTPVDQLHGFFKEFLGGGGTRPPVTEQQARRFLCAFVNWDFESEGVKGLVDDPFLSRFLPQQPSRWPDWESPADEPPDLRLWRCAYYQSYLRAVWSKRFIPLRVGRYETWFMLGRYCAFLLGTESLRLGLHAYSIGDVRILRAIARDGFMEVMVQAVTLYPSMKVCKNPGCARPYFLADRKDQKLCGAADCKAWADRRDKRRSWKKHKLEWRPPKAKRPSKKSRKGGK